MSGVHATGLASEGELRPDSLFDAFEITRKVTIAAGSGPLQRGTALGQVTAGGKWVKSLAAATNGSQSIQAILLHDVDGTADVEAIVGLQGRVNPKAVIFGAGHGAASPLIARGLMFETAIG